VAAAFLLFAACLLALAAPFARVVELPHLPVLQALIYGLAIVGAAAVLAWATEVAQLEIPRALAYSVLALIAVLPEYAVDMYFAWAAGTRPEYTAYAAANMTGANRLLIGIGWPLVVLLAWLTAQRWRRPASNNPTGATAQLPVSLPSDARLDIAVLALATLYAFLLPFKASISLLDGAILIGLFAFYAWRVAQAHRAEPELLGPAALIARLPTALRRAATVLLFLLAAISIFSAAEPFAEALIETGTVLDIDRFLLVQWLAPFASEAPELVVVSLLALRRQGGLGLAALLSSKVNQWTLLVGMLPLAYSLGASELRALPLDSHQAEEVLLTAAQSLLAVAVLLDLRLSGRDAWILFLLFSVQFVVPAVRLPVTVVYLVLAGLLLVVQRDRFRDYLPSRRAAEPVGPEPKP
jgi:cation:H+ antiporter